MRTDTAIWTQKNLDKSKEPRYVVRLSFDSANSIIYEFASHSDCATGGGTVIASIVKNISGSSQTLNPDQANASIGNISFEIDDKASAVNSALGSQLTLGRSTREQRVQIYVGWKDDAWADYTLFATQLVDEISYKDGVYAFRCADIQRAMRKEIFDLEITTLTSSVTASDTTINVVDTTDFTMVAHGTSYSDAPSATVGYIRIEDEIIRYTGKTATTFTGCTRGVLNTKAAEHIVDTAATQDRRTKVEEVVYLEMPAPKLAYALLTGTLYGQGGATLPTAWHLGISTSYVRLADFTGIGADIWDTADDTAGIIVRFEGITKTDGKQFIEQQLMILLGCFMPVYNDGALGLRRMAAVLAGAAYVKQLDESNVVNYGDLTHDFRALHNQIQIDWNWDPLKKRYTRTNLLIDSNSVTVHGKAEPLKLKFQGLHGSRAADTALDRRFAAIRDRYTGPPLRLSVECLPSLNTLEVGDIVRVKLANVRDFVANGTLDRSFEIQNVQIDWITGKVNLSLFASSQSAGAIDATQTGTALSDSFYTAAGTDLSTVLTIAAGHVTANGNLAGASTMAAGLYYYNGDLTIDSGVTVTVNNNVQLRIKGFLQINGIIDGVGRGNAGAIAPAANCDAGVGSGGACYSYIDDYAAGTQGAIGTTLSAGGVRVIYSATAMGLYDTHQGYLVKGINDTVPEFNITHASTSIAGLPTDLRGSSGSSGHVSGIGQNTGTLVDKTATAGNGGAGGAGFMVISRGFAFGASGKVDLSGSDGSVGSTFTDALGYTYYSGSGAGGAPGGGLFILDGSSATDDTLTGKYVGTNGVTPIPTNAIIDRPRDALGSYYTTWVGFAGTENAPAPDLSGYNGGCRVQRIYPNATTEADVSATLRSPTSLALESGTNALLVNGDGTVVTRIKVTWTASTDPRTLAYDIQFKPSADSVWPSAVTIPGATSALTYISPVKDGVNYDVRIRAAADYRQVSDWVTITSHTVIGKSAPPEDVAGFTASQNGALIVLRWNEVGDADLAGYDVRFGLTTTSYANATPIGSGITLRGTNITSAAVPPGTWRFFIKAQDTSGNQSNNASTFDVTVTSGLDIVFQQEQSPDWLGEIYATGDNLLLEDGSALLKESGELLMLESATDTFVRTYDGKLIPNSTLAASAHTNAELFETFVPYPVPVAIYDAPEIDISFDDDPRVWGSITAELAQGGTGIADPDLYIDYRTAAGSYGGFTRRDIGQLTGRYFKHRLYLDTSEGDVIVTGFLPTVDQEEWTQSSTETIGAGGSTITFGTAFHTVPTVQATALGASALMAVVDPNSITTTGCTVHIYNTSGTSVGGTATIDATGV